MRIIRRLIRHLISCMSYTRRTLWAYRGIFWWLLTKKGWRAFYNFLFVKMFVRVGEGGTGVFYSWISPVFIYFPWLAAVIAPYPFDVEIEITNRCNKKCLFCEHTYWKEPSADLKYDEFLRIVGQFPNLKWVNLTGEGDSFLNKDFMRMVRYLKERDVCVYFVDSFDLINEKIAEELVDLGVDGIFVSMDGATRETYEAIKIGCNFERTMKNIRNLVRIKKEKNSPLPEINFRYVVCTKNLADTVEFIEFVASLGGREVLGPTSDIEFAGVLKFPETEHLYADLPGEVREGMVRRARELGLIIHFAHTSTDKLPHIKFCSPTQPYIMMGGYVMPCCGVLQSNNRDFLRQHAMGNVFKQDFKDIWHSQNYKHLRKMVPRVSGPIPFLCQGCRGVDPGGRT